MKRGDRCRPRLVSAGPPSIEDTRESMSLRWNDARSTQDRPDLRQTREGFPAPAPSGIGSNPLARSGESVGDGRARGRAYPAKGGMCWSLAWSDPTLRQGRGLTIDTKGRIESVGDPFSVRPELSEEGVGTCRRDLIESRVAARSTDRGVPNVEPGAVPRGPRRARDG